MMMPSIFGENLFDDFDLPFEKSFFGDRNPFYGKHAKNIMKTDVRETENAYELDIDLPGFKKEDINISLDNGYLQISAEKTLNKDETDKKGKYIRRERYGGSVSRSFYIGEAITHEDVHAKFENGILKLSMPKKEAKALEANRHIAIE